MGYKGNILENMYKVKKIYINTSHLFATSTQSYKQTICFSISFITRIAMSIPCIDSSKRCQGFIVRIAGRHIKTSDNSRAFYKFSNSSTRLLFSVIGSAEYMTKTNPYLLQLT